VNFIKSHKNWIIAGYILLMVFSFFYVRKVLSEGDLKVTTREKSRGFDEKPAKVTLIIAGPGIGVKYTVDMKNTDTVMDLLDKVSEEQGLEYDMTSYVNRTEFEHINGIKAPEGYVWKLLQGDSDLTEYIQNTKLRDENIYRIILVAN